MRDESRDLLAREILIGAALVVASFVLALALSSLGYVSDVLGLFLVLYALRWVLWAGLHAAARPEQHPYLRRLSEFTAAGLLLIDLAILVHGFRSGGPSLGHWLLAAPLGTLAVFLLQKSARRARLRRA